MSKIAAALEFLFPNHTCLICKSELNTPKNKFICDACIQKLPHNKEPVLLKRRCTRHFNRALAAFWYKDEIANLILRLKYNNEGCVAAALAPFMAAVHKKSKLRTDILIPVPLFEKRFKSRGYNQALLLAAEISKITHIPVVADALERKKNTQTQNNMTPTERAANQRNAFAVIDPFQIEGKRILLIDDVFTTGATTNECARVLRKAGAVSVNVLTVACA